jgi:hypothetical protein
LFCGFAPPPPDPADPASLGLVENPVQVLKNLGAFAEDAKACEATDPAESARLYGVLAGPSMRRISLRMPPGSAGSRRGSFRPPEIVLGRSPSCGTWRGIISIVGWPASSVRYTRNWVRSGRTLINCRLRSWRRSPPRSPGTGKAVSSPWPCLPWKSSRPSAIPTPGSLPAFSSNRPWWTAGMTTIRRTRWSYPAGTPPICLTDSGGARQASRVPT